MAQIRGDSSVVGASAVFGGSVVARGVEGHSTNDHGVVGVTFGPGTGVFGVGTKGRGVEGESTENHAIVGTSKGIGTGVFGVGTKGRGVEGQSTENHAIVGTSKGKGAGVFGITDDGNGVEGRSTNQIGVFGKGGRLAGKFEGNVEVTGNLNCGGTVNTKGTVTCFDVSISNADCAEEFELTSPQTVEPGTLMSFGADDSVCPSSGSYDNKVAGVISGAGEYQPGIVLDRRQGRNRVPIALLGKVFCKVDAQYAPIDVGDLLTTSPTVGHAMKATDRVLAFGSVIGKALRPQAEGRGMIPILVNLQ